MQVRGDGIAALYVKSGISPVRRKTVFFGRKPDLGSGCWVSRQVGYKARITFSNSPQVGGKYATVWYSSQYTTTSKQSQPGNSLRSFCCALGRSVPDIQVAVEDRIPGFLQTMLFGDQKKTPFEGPKVLPVPSHRKFVGLFGES